MTLRTIAGLGALLSPRTPGTRLALATTLDSGDTPRKPRALGPLLLVAIPRPASSLCISAQRLAFAGGAPAGAGMRLRGLRPGDALISRYRSGIPIRGST